MGEFAIGQAVPRFEDPRLVKGHGRYVADMVFPGMAFGHVLRSPHAHARIRAIDIAKAKAAPGVLAVLTGADYKAAGFGDLPVPGGLKRRDGVPGYRPCYPALAKDRVRRIGDYVAFVVAENCYQAIDAAELIEVDYEPLPAIARPPTRSSPARRWFGTIAPTISASSISKATRRRPTRHLRAPRMWSSIASSSTASPPRPWSRAAASASSAGRRPLHDLHDPAAHAHLSDGAVAVRAEGSGEQDPRGRRATSAAASA